MIRTKNFGRTLFCVALAALSMSGCSDAPDRIDTFTLCGTVHDKDDKAVTGSAVYSITYLSNGQLGSGTAYAQLDATGFGCAEGNVGYDVSPGDFHLKSLTVTVGADTGSGKVTDFDFDKDHNSMMVDATFKLGDTSKSDPGGLAMLLFKKTLGLKPSTAAAHGAVSNRSGEASLKSDDGIATLEVPVKKNAGAAI